MGIVVGEGVLGVLEGIERGKGRGGGGGGEREGKEGRAMWVGDENGDRERGRA